jgi:carboxyl-terminal processing protease
MTMKKLVITALGGTLAGAIAAMQVAGPLLAEEKRTNNELFEQLDLFGDIFERIRGQYVEPVDNRKLIEAAINGMLTSLDPHSSYLNAESAADMTTQTRGEFGGLGIEVTQENGFVKVISPMDGTPAAEAGIQAGDFITHVDGEAMQGITLNEAVDKMRGPVGTDIVVTVVREGVAEPFDLTLTRATIKITAVRSRVVGNTAVLRITTFSDQTYPGLQEELEKTVQQIGGIDKVTGFVIDLRNNPGGLLRQAIMVSDAFLDKGEIVSTRGREATDGTRENATPGDLAQGKPIVVLINGGSASASEIVAGALQDHRRAIVVGTKSFGKGSVQTLMPLKDGGQMRLTTARYYTPSGRSIQALGVMPDIVVHQPKVEDPDKQGIEAQAADESADQRSEADLRGAITNDSMSEDEIKLLEAERARTVEAAKLRDEDYQLAYAVDILRGLAAVAPQP